MVFVYIFRLAAAEQAYQARAKAEGQNQKEMKRLRLVSRGSGHHGISDQGSAHQAGQGPSSLFLLSERNILRRTTKFLIGKESLYFSYDVNFKFLFFRVAAL